jgi:hypothetical protein
MTLKDSDGLTGDTSAGTRPQRQFGRMQVACPAVVHLAHLSAGSQDERFLDGVVADLSISGLGVVLASDPFSLPSIGARARVIIERRAAPRQIECMGEVVKSETTEDGGHRLGIRFDRVRHDVMLSAAQHSRVLVELDPYGWTEYRRSIQPDAP